MTHKVVKIENLMYKGCEAHWGCTRCGYIVPFHCYKREELEQRECKPVDIERWKQKKNRTWHSKGE